MVDMQDIGLISLGGTVEYQYRITNPTGGPVYITSVWDSELEELAEGGFELGPEASRTLFATAEIYETTTNTVTVTSDLCTPAEASATVTVDEPLPAGADSCLEGKPRELVFEYTGDDCDATTNYQEGKFDCSEPNDPLSGDFPVQFVLTLTGKDAGKVTVSPTTQVVTINDPDRNKVTFTATGSRLPSSTTFDIVHTPDGQETPVVLQSLDIHTSCSAPLAVGDQFGGVVLKTFIPEQ